MSSLLDILDDQGVLACLVDKEFNFVSITQSLEEFLFYKNIVNPKQAYSMKAYHFFTREEGDEISKLLDNDTSGKVNYVKRLEKFNSQISEVTFYKDGENCIAVFEPVQEEEPLADKKNIDNLLESFKRLVFINKVGFIQVNGDLQITDLITNNLDLFEVSPDIGTNLKNCFDKDLLNLIKKNVKRKTNKEKVDIFEYSIESEETIKWYLFEVSRIGSGSIIVIKDITDEKRKMRVEVENDRLTTLGILAGGLAHQFNNIHHVILGNLDLINYVDTQEQLNDCLATVKSSVDKASKLTQKLLSFSRSKKECIEPYNLERIIRSSYEFTEEKFLKANIDFSITKKGKGPFIAQIDPALFEQVLINLIINSIQAMNKTAKNNFIKIKLEHSQSGDQVFCDVCDSGDGIKIENIDKIFTPLFTTKNTSAKGIDERGTGLGLSLSKKLIADMKGDLHLVETSSKGSIFRITLKRAEPKQLEIFKNESIGLGLDPRSKFNVVLFDDEHDTRDYVKKYFETCSEADLTTYKDGDVDIEQLINSKPDVILLDWIMPKKNGNEVLKDINSNSKNLLSKVIVISGHIPDKEFDEWEDKVFARLEKPLSISELNKALF